MKKYLKWIVTLLIVASIFGVYGCKQESEPISIDKTAPANIGKLEIVASNGTAILSWTNPSDSDFSGVELSMNPATSSLSNSIIIPKDSKSFSISGLTNGTEYTFTVKSVDTSGNKSGGVTKSVTVEDTSDKTPPAEVTELKALNRDGSVLLTWQDAKDEDIYGYEVTWDKTTPINRSTTMVANSIMIAPNSQGCYISNLTNGTEYTFTVKSVDTNGNKSGGVIVKIKPEIKPKDALKILLSQSPTEKTNQDIVISVETETDSESEILQITYVENIVADIDEVLKGTDITDSREIIVSENSSYTVAATDTAGRRELEFILISNIDKDAPGQIENLDTTFSRAKNSIILTWSNPKDPDIEKIIVTYDTNGEKTETFEIEGSCTSTEIPNIPVNDDVTYNISVKVKDDVGNIGSEVKTSVIAECATVTKVSLSSSKVKLGTSGSITATIIGSKFDKRGETVIKLINSSNEVIDEIDVPLESNNEDGTEFKVDFDIPSTDDTYTIAIFFEGIKERKECELLVYGSLEITEIIIPKAGESFKGENIPISIIGKNFKSPDVDVSKFEGDAENFQIISDTKVTAEVKCPTGVGKNTIKISYDSESKEAELEVVEASKCFTVGDVLFTDGTRMKAENVEFGIPNEMVSKAFAVIVSAPYGGGSGKAVGLKKSSQVSWAPTGTIGYNTHFTDIEIKVNSEESTSFTGDLEGSDNWEYICSIDPEGSENAAVNYPAFDFANNYGVTANLCGTNYEEGWYVPSLVELYEIKNNETLIQDSLNLVRGPSLNYYYWSSSVKSGSDSHKAWRLHLSDWKISGMTKSSNDHVLAFHLVNSEDFSEYVVSTVPEIESVLISSVAEGYTGEVPVTILGKNLIGHPITCDDETFKTVKYGNSKVTATIYCDGIIEDTQITLTCGSSSGTGVLKVVDSSKIFNIGDILFTDGTRIKMEDAQYGIPDEKLSKAFAVIVSVSYDGGIGKAIGLQKSHSKLAWASTGTTGYTEDFTEIKCSRDSNIASVAMFEGDLEGSDNWDYICKIDPTGTQDAATNYPVFHFANTYGVENNLSDTEFVDGWYIPSAPELCAIVNNLEEIETALEYALGSVLGEDWYWTSSTFNATNILRVSFSKDTVEGEDKASSDSAFGIAFRNVNPEDFSVYDIDSNPVIQDVEIMSVAEGYIGKVMVSITGENLKGKEVICDDVTFGDVNYVCDTRITATISSDGVVGEKVIKVSCGSSSSSGIFRVVSSEKCFAIGDIILTNGEKVSVNDLINYTIDENNKPIGVVASLGYNGGTGKIVGIKKSSALMWASSEVNGFKKHFSKIRCEATSDDAITATFESIYDLEGFDNWDYICSLDFDGVQDAETNYPAFDFAQKYGATAGLSETNYANGWYIPTLKELCDLYKNKDKIQKSLTMVAGFDIGSSFYWTSSQGGWGQEVYRIDFSDADIDGESKDSSPLNYKGPKAGGGAEVLVFQNCFAM